MQEQLEVGLDMEAFSSGVLSAAYELIDTSDLSSEDKNMVREQFQAAMENFHPLNTTLTLTNFSQDKNKQENERKVGEQAAAYAYAIKQQYLQMMLINLVNLRVIPVKLPSDLSNVDVYDFLLETLPVGSAQSQAVLGTAGIFIKVKKDESLDAVRVSTSPREGLWNKIQEMVNKYLQEFANQGIPGVTAAEARSANGKYAAQTVQQEFSSPASPFVTKLVASPASERESIISDNYNSNLRNMGQDLARIRMQIFSFLLSQGDLIKAFDLLRSMQNVQEVENEPKFHSPFKIEPVLVKD